MGVVQDIGHILLEVGDMDVALRFYRDALGMAVQGTANPTWTVVAATGGSLTLFRKKTPNPCVLKGGGTPLDLHVSNFEEASTSIERAGYKVERRDSHGGGGRGPRGKPLRVYRHPGGIIWPPDPGGPPP